MTAPKHAREIKGRGRYYGSCSDGCPFGDQVLISVTNAQGVVNKPALPPSAAKLTAAAAWARLPQMVATSRQPEHGGNGCDRKRVADRCGRCRFCVNAAIKAEYQQQWESKAELGTRVHAAAHGLVLGEPQPWDDDVSPFIDQYLEFYDRTGTSITEHVEAAETTILDRKNGYAGTGDVWLWLPYDPKDGRFTGPKGKRWLYLVDLKTSLTKPANTVYVDQVLQLAGLRYAPSAVLPDDSEIPVPKFAGAALLNLRTDAHALIPLPADRAAHKAFVNAVGLRSYLNDQDVKTWVPLDLPVVPEPTRRKVA